mmetsp:Transcript_117441/g.228325  ORF Transcript_117441/g.228325 Transcript_117441/m.228325 type:complete len:97 (+) Transcript_117441:261-551(+)
MHHVLHFPDIKRRYFDAASRGVYPDALMEVFDEECGWEDFWPHSNQRIILCIQCAEHKRYPAGVGILLSSYGIATYMCETVDLHISDSGYAPMAEE